MGIVRKLRKLRYVKIGRAIKRRLGLGAQKMNIYSAKFGFMIGKKVNSYMTGETERDKVKFIIENVKRGDTFIDIGANIGYISLVAGSKGAEVYAVEPEITNLKKLNLQVVLNVWDVVVIPKAVSSNNGKLFLEPEGGRSKVSSVKASETAYEVPTVTIDRLVKDENLSRVDWIKIDVEGHELEVLKGCQDTLKKFKPNILLDVHQPMVEPAECLALVEKAGYKMKSLRGKKLDFVLYHKESEIEKKL